MADIVIRGMEMPKEPPKITLYPDGCWCDYTSNDSHGKFVVLPEGHGRLVDADALESIIGGFSLNWEYGQGVSDCWDALISAPTILEAEGGLRNDP